MNIRKLAWDTLCRFEKAGQYSNLALDAVLKKYQIADADRALLTALIYGTIERQTTLDYWVDTLVQKPPEAEIRVLLRLGLYQLAFLDRVPDHAAVNETVSLAPKRASGFVNAILRSFLRAGKTFPPPDRETDPVGFLSVTGAVCRPLAEKMISVFGLERSASILAATLQKSGICLRWNPLKVDFETFENALRAAGYEPTPVGKTGFRLSAGAPISKLPGFSEGWFFVQDEASQRCVSALEAKPGMVVLDVCACPGSKSFGAALDMNNQGRVLSFDLHASKLSLVTSGAGRLGITILSAAERDARRALPEWENKADRVICDVPCSGFGVLSKKPELRLKSPETSAELPAIQSAILARSATLVRPGGRLVYSTCTIFPEENEGVVAPFLRDHPDFELIGQQTLYPDTDGTDGFFYAVLERKN